MSGPFRRENVNAFSRLTQKNGFSIAEALVAAIVFSISAVGILTTTSKIRQPAGSSARNTQAAYYGEQILEDLRAKITPEEWGSGALAEGQHVLPANGPYKAVYFVENDPAGSGARRVSLNITWDEP